MPIDRRYNVGNVSTNTHNRDFIRYDDRGLGTGQGLEVVDLSCGVSVDTAGQPVRCTDRLSTFRAYQNSQHN